MARTNFRKIRDFFVSAPILSVVALFSGITMAMGGSTGLVVGLVGISVYFLFIVSMSILDKKSS